MQSSIVSFSKLLLLTVESRASIKWRTMAVTSAGRYEHESRDSTTPNVAAYTMYILLPFVHEYINNLLFY